MLCRLLLCSVHERQFMTGTVNEIHAQMELASGRVRRDIEGRIGDES